MPLLNDITWKTPGAAVRSVKGVIGGGTVDRLHEAVAQPVDQAAHAGGGVVVQLRIGGQGRHPDIGVGGCLHIGQHRAVHVGGIDVGAAGGHRQVGHDAQFPAGAKLVVGQVLAGIIAAQGQRQRAGQLQIGFINVILAGDGLHRIGDTGSQAWLIIGPRCRDYHFASRLDNPQHHLDDGRRRGQIV